MKESGKTSALLQDIKDMLMGLTILIVGGSVLTCGGIVFFLGLFMMVIGAGFVWQGWRNHKTAEKQD